MKSTCHLADLVTEIKKSSIGFIKEKKFTKFKFNWQDGYGAFSFGYSALDNVIAYIANQKELHKKQSFKDEYIALLNKFQIEHEDKYLFEFIE